MPTIIILLFLGMIGTLMYFYEKYKKLEFIASVIDGTNVDNRYVTDACLLVIEQLKDRKSLRLDKYSNLIKLPDGQYISYRTDNIDKFKHDSQLTFEPTETEWKILAGLIQKLYNSN
jgi:hypothetical protein